MEESTKSYPALSEVAEGIHMIAHYPENSVWGFQAFVIADEKPALIEPGPTAFAPRILHGLQQLGYHPASLSYIIPTHVHVDHCGGTGYLARYALKAKVIAHESGARHFSDPTRLIEATRSSWGENYDSEMGNIAPVPQDKVEAVRDGKKINLGRRTLSIIHTPGHAKHHICIHDSNSQGLFCGDCLGMLLPGDKPEVIPIAPAGFELDLALESIARLKRLKPQAIFYSHFGVSYQASKCLELAEQSMKWWADIALQALKDNETREQLKNRFRTLVEKLQPERIELFSQFIDWATDGYTSYFTRKGLVANKIEQGH